MSFGTNLQFLRDRADMTQEALAEALQVSRQSVSKWESDASFPEMDKLLVLCRLFHTDLDTLVRGDVKEHFRTDAWGYDRHMNWFSNAVAAAMALIFLSVGGALGLYSLGAVSGRGLAAVLISGVALAVAILVVASIRHSTFEQEHPVIQDFYTGAQRERFLAIYPFLIALPVAAFFIAVVCLLLLDGWAGAVALLLFIVGAAVTVLVWAALRRGKYDVAQWNAQHDPSPEAVARRKRTERICSVIMLAAVAIHLAAGFILMALRGEHSGWGWQWGWIVYPVAGVLCGLAGNLTERDGT